MVYTIHRVLDSTEWNYYHLKTYLEKDATSVNDLDCEFYVTPLHRVLMSDKCSLDMVKLLIHYGADVNLVSRISSALFIALMYHKSKDIIRVLLEAGADVNATDEYYIMPPLCMALRSGASAEIIELLLESGCPIDNSGEYSSMLHCATYYELKADVCKLLLQAGAGDVKKLDKHGESVLCYALRQGTELEAIKMLLDAGCSLTACQEHESAWLCATSFSSMLKGDILKVLHEACIDISPVNELTETPLQCALRYCVYETSAIRLLLDLQVGKVAKSRTDKRLLLDATSNHACKLGTVKLLIERQVRVNVVDDFGDTPLHLMLRYNSCPPDIIKHLLEKGVPVNEKNCCGDTPLRVAVEKAHKMNILELLLRGGARIFMPHDYKVPLLRLLLTQYYLNPFAQEHYDTFKIFLKYTFLEDINFEIGRIFPEINLNYDVFLGFARECVHELQEMKLKKIGGCIQTLHELIDRDDESEMDLDVLEDLDAEPYDFNQLVTILRNNKYPVYFDVISSNVGREKMLIELEDVRIYTETSSPDTPCVQNKVILNYECACKIAEILSESDLLNLIIAFSIPEISSS